MSTPTHDRELTNPPSSRRVRACDVYAVIYARPSAPGSAASGGDDYTSTDVERLLTALANSSAPPAGVVIDPRLPWDNTSQTTLPTFVADRPLSVSHTAVAAIRSAAALLRERAGGDAAAAHDQWLWFLPPDASPAPNCLESLCEAVCAREDVDVAGPKLSVADDANALHHVGYVNTLFGSLAALGGAGEHDQGQHDHIDDVQVLDPTGLLLRSQAAGPGAGAHDAMRSPLGAAAGLCYNVRAAGRAVVLVPAATLQVPHVSAVHRGDGVLHRLARCPWYAMPVLASGIVIAACLRFIVWCAVQRPVTGWRRARESLAALTRPRAVLSMRAYRRSLASTAGEATPARTDAELRLGVVETLRYRRDQWRELTGEPRRQHSGGAHATPLPDLIVLTVGLGLAGVLMAAAASRSLSAAGITGTATPERHGIAARYPELLTGSPVGIAGEPVQWWWALWAQVTAGHPAWGVWGAAALCLPVLGLLTFAELRDTTRTGWRLALAGVAAVNPVVVGALASGQLALAWAVVAGSWVASSALRGVMKPPRRPLGHAARLGVGVAWIASCSVPMALLAVPAVMLAAVGSAARGGHRLLAGAAGLLPACGLAIAGAYLWSLLTRADITAFLRTSVIPLGRQDVPAGQSAAWWWIGHVSSPFATGHGPVSTILTAAWTGAGVAILAGAIWGTVRCVSRASRPRSVTWYIACAWATILACYAAASLALRGEYAGADVASVLIGLMFAMLCLVAGTTLPSISARGDGRRLLVALAGAAGVVAVSVHALWSGVLPRSEAALPRVVADGLAGPMHPRALVISGADSTKDSMTVRLVQSETLTLAGNHPLAGSDPGTQELGETVAALVGNSSDADERLRALGVGYVVFDAGAEDGEQLPDATDPAAAAGTTDAAGDEGRLSVLSALQGHRLLSPVAAPPGPHAWVVGVRDGTDRDVAPSAAWLRDVNPERVTPSSANDVGVFGADDDNVYEPIPWNVAGTTVRVPPGQETRHIFISAPASEFWSADRDGVNLARTAEAPTAFVLGQQRGTVRVHYVDEIRDRWISAGWVITGVLALLAVPSARRAPAQNHQTSAEKRRQGTARLARRTRRLGPRGPGRTGDAHQPHDAAHPTTEGGTT